MFGVPHVKQQSILMLKSYLLITDRGMLVIEGSCMICQGPFCRSFEEACSKLTVTVKPTRLAEAYEYRESIRLNESLVSKTG